jgi:hypothetical protein
MKRIAMAAMVVAMGFVVMVSTGFSAEPKYSGFLAGYYTNLKPGLEGGAKERWIKPGVDFSQYKRFMVDSVIFYFADDSENKGIDPDEMMTLANACNKAIIDALKDKYPVVGEPAPDVARIRFAITKLKQSRPGMGAVSSVVPIGLGLSLIKKGATGSWSGSGATGVELMVLDSTTNDVIAVAVDDRTAGYTERFTKWGSAEDAFKFWGEQIRKFADSQAAKQ